jgi:hypothetical protein
MTKNGIILNWLNKEFGNLTEVVRDDRTFYVDKDRKPLFFYFQDSKIGIVYVNYERIWIFFESIFGLKDPQTKVILTIWLEETYNLRGVTPDPGIAFPNILLEETYNLRGVTPSKYTVNPSFKVGGDL